MFKGTIGQLKICITTPGSNEITSFKKLSVLMIFNSFGLLGSLSIDEEIKDQMISAFKITDETERARLLVGILKPLGNSASAIALEIANQVKLPCDIGKMQNSYSPNYSGRFG